MSHVTLGFGAMEPGKIEFATENNWVSSFSTV